MRTTYADEPDACVDMTSGEPLLDGLVKVTTNSTSGAWFGRTTDGKFFIKSQRVHEASIYQQMYMESRPEEIDPLIDQPRYLFWRDCGNDICTPLYGLYRALDSCKPKGEGALAYDLKGRIDKRRKTKVHNGSQTQKDGDFVDAKKALHVADGAEYAMLVDHFARTAWWLGNHGLFDYSLMIYIGETCSEKCCSSLPSCSGSRFPCKVGLALSAQVVVVGGVIDVLHHLGRPLKAKTRAKHFVLKMGQFVFGNQSKSARRYAYSSSMSTPRHYACRWFFFMSTVVFKPPTDSEALVKQKLEEQLSHSVPIGSVKSLWWLGTTWDADSIVRKVLMWTAMEPEPAARAISAWCRKNTLEKPQDSH